MRQGWTEVAFTEIAKLVRRPVEVVATGQYPEVGVRCFGKGLFHKPARSGLEVGDKKLFRLQRGDFILQVTFAWEGAVGVVNAEDESLLGSVRVLTFEVDRSRTTPEFLLRYFQTRDGVDQLARISPGSAGRNRVLATQRLSEVTVPLPPLAEQRRLAAHCDAVETRLALIRQLREESQAESLALLRSLISETHSRAVRRVPMNELVTWRTPDTPVSQSESYTFAGVYSFGRGVFRKESVSGLDFAYDRLTRLRAGEFTYPKLMAWEGALGVVPDDCDGCYVSPEFPVFTVHEELVRPVVLDIHFKTPAVWRNLAALSPGTNLRRRRLNPTEFLRYPFPLPPMDLQTKVEALARRTAAKSSLEESMCNSHSALLPSLLDRIFHG
jgi:type I restriction enzyme S subunit